MSGYVCKLCGYDCKTGAGFSRHEKARETPKRLKCKQCVARFMHQCDLYRHLRDQHAASSSPSAGAKRPFSSVGDNNDNNDDNDNDGFGGPGLLLSVTLLPASRTKPPPRHALPSAGAAPPPRLPPAVTLTALPDAADNFHRARRLARVARHRPGHCQRLPGACAVAAARRLVQFSDEPIALLLLALPKGSEFWACRIYTCLAARRVLWAAADLGWRATARTTSSAPHLSKKRPGTECDCTEQTCGVCAIDHASTARETCGVGMIASYVCNWPKKDLHNTAAWLSDKPNDGALACAGASLPRCRA